MAVWTTLGGKLQSLNILTKLDYKFPLEKKAHSACLLPVILLLPYFGRGHASFLIGTAYTCLILLSANPITAFKNLGNKLAECYWRLTDPVLQFLIRVYEPLDKLEKSFMDLQNLGIMLNQLIFFGSCSALLLPGQPVTGLYTLMFYNVFAYCVSYIKELCEKEDWSPYVNVAEHSNMKHLAMTATKIALEWTKAVTFIITIVFMLLVFGLEQGLEHYKPTVSYTLITWVYYASTEKVFVTLLSYFINYLQLSIFENLEALWIPVILYLFTSSMAFIVAILSMMFGRFKFAVAALYLNVYIRLKDLSMNHLQELQAERAVLSQFRYASREEISSLEDVCAVCLSTMSFARVTPCHHLFHGDCLRKCLKTSNQCPICKRELKFD